MRFDIDVAAAAAAVTSAATVAGEYATGAETLNGVAARVGGALPHSGPVGAAVNGLFTAVVVPQVTAIADRTATAVSATGTALSAYAAGDQTMAATSVASLSQAVTPASLPGGGGF